MIEQDHILKVLKKIGEAMQAENVHWALGASLLLYFHGLTDTFHDIDIMTSVEDAAKVRQILIDLGGELHPTAPNAGYRTQCFYEFTLDGTEIDVMAGMKIVSENVCWDCSMEEEKIEGSTRLDGTVIPLYSLKEWRRFYALMGRDAKVKMIDQGMAEKMFTKNDEAR